MKAWATYLPDATKADTQERNLQPEGEKGQWATGVFFPGKRHCQLGISSLTHICVCWIHSTTRSPTSSSKGRICSSVSERMTLQWVAKNPTEDIQQQSLAWSLVPQWSPRKHLGQLALPEDPGGAPLTLCSWCGVHLLCSPSHPEQGWPVLPTGYDGNYGTWLLRLCHKRHCGSLPCCSHITCPGGSQLPCLEDTQAVLWRGPNGEELRPLPVTMLRGFFSVKCEWE